MPYHSSKMNAIRTGNKPKPVIKTNPSFAPSKPIKLKEASNEFFIPDGKTPIKLKENKAFVPTKKGKK